MLMLIVIKMKTFRILIGWFAVIKKAGVMLISLRCWDDLEQARRTNQKEHKQQKLAAHLSY